MYERVAKKNKDQAWRINQQIFQRKGKGNARGGFVDKRSDSVVQQRLMQDITNNVDSPIGTLDNTPIQGAFWAAMDDGSMVWHEEEVNEDWLPAGRTHDDDEHEGNVYYRAGSLRGTANLVGQSEETAVIEGEEDNLLLSCWHWALTGFQGGGVYPQHVYSYARKKQQVLEGQLEFDAEDWIRTEVPAEEGRQWLLDNHAGIDLIMARWWADLTEEGEMPEDADYTATTAITRKVIEANGFTVSDEPTPYQVCMHYTEADGITFDHWWIKVDDTVAETFPGTRDDETGEVTAGVEDIQIMKEEQDHDDMRVIRFYVTELKEVQRNKIIDTINAVVGGE